jgi:hypothetical protein
VHRPLRIGTASSWPCPRTGGQRHRDLTGITIWPQFCRPRAFGSRGIFQAHDVVGEGRFAGTSPVGSFPANGCGLVDMI